MNTPQGYSLHFMRQTEVDFVKYSLGAIPAEKGGISGMGGVRSVFRLLLDLEARLRKQRREESKMAFGRRQIFRADRVS
jgi:hypothetical protein